MVTSSVVKGIINQCDMAVFINNKIEALVLVSGQNSTRQTETNPEDCRIAMHFELDTFITEWNKIDPGNIDLSRLPPLFHFIIKATDQKLVPNFYNYENNTSIKRVYDSPSLLRESDENAIREILVIVDHSKRSLVYFGQTQSRDKPDKTFSDIKMFVTLYEFLQEWKNRDQGEIAEGQSRLPRLFYFVKLNDVYDVKCFHEPQCKFPPSSGSGLGATVVKSPDLTDLVNAGR